MYRLIFLVLLTALLSCSKDDPEPPQVVIPDIINGTVLEINVTPADLVTPKTGFLVVSMTNTYYKVTFNAVDEAASNATILFATDSILSDDSREYANLGKDAVAYQPLKPNEVFIIFNDGRKVDAIFDVFTTFGGVFGEDVISQWREASDPTKPNKKAIDDIMELVRRYSDKDGAGPGTTPVFLKAEVSKL